MLFQGANLFDEKVTGSIMLPVIILSFRFKPQQAISVTHHRN